VRVTPTINSIGIRIRPVPDEVTGAALYWRKQGETQWRRGLDPVITVANALLEARAAGGTYENLDVVTVEKGAMIRRCHGNVVLLEAGTTYEVRVDLKRADGSLYDSVQRTVTTWAERYPFGESTGRTLNVPGDYSTIQAALNAASPGDIVLVAPGTRYEEVSISSSTSGTEGHPITIRGQGTVLQDNPTSPDTNAFFRFLDNAHDIVIEGFELRGLRGYGGYTLKNKQLTIVGNNVQRVVIRNNLFNSPSDVTQSSWMLMSGGNGYVSPTKVLIEGNTFTAGKLTTGSLGSVIFFEGGKQVVIRNNTIRAGESEDIISLRGGPREDFDFANNTVVGKGFDDGMELEGCVNINVRMWGNTIDDSLGQKGTMSHTPVLVGPIYVFRNVLYGGLQTYKVASNMVINFDFANLHLADFGPVFWYHNTIFHPYTAAIGTDTPQFFRYSNRLCHANVTLQNNIVYNRYLPSTAGQATTYNRQDPNAEYASRWGQLTSDYNLWYPQATNPNASYGLDLHSIFGQDPGFFSATWGQQDVHLMPGSAAIDRGIPIPNISDTFRGTAPDLGAFEAVSEFSDVSPAYWAWAEIEACYAAGIVSGYPDGTYRPSTPVTRDQMAVYVSRAISGGDAYIPTTPGTVTFPDVPQDYWAYRWVEYAAANNIVQGYDDGKYRPTLAVDRGQMAVFIARSIATPTLGDAGLVDYTPPPTPTFPDVTSTNAWAWCYRYVEYIAAAGIVHGYDDGRYHPEVICTRDQMAVYVAHAFDLLP
jgi:hypothetical protein